MYVEYATAFAAYVVSTFGLPLEHKCQLQNA